MNKQRRKAIEELSEELKNLLDQAQTILDEEQDSYDNLPENLQESERGVQSEEAISSLECVRDAISEAIESLVAAGT